MEDIKEAFGKVKEDIFFLREEVEAIRKDMSEVQKTSAEIINFLNKMHEDQRNTKEQQTFLEKEVRFLTQTQVQEASTDFKELATQKHLFRPLNTQNMVISTGNGGVPTDRQTNRQTNRQTQNKGFLDINAIESAAEILDSLDNLKKEIRLKFKKLTDQEMLVFSTIYQLEEEKGYSDYKTLSQKLTLTESSIRDYVGRLIRKGVPIEKHKINNKEIQLRIPLSLRKIASLDTILQLRGL